VTNHLFKIGLLIYFASFFLMAVGHSDGLGRPAPGYYCAFVALFLSWTTTPLSHGGPFENRSFEYLAVLVTGLINPFLIVYLILIFRERNFQLARVLRVIVPLMIPFSWVVFHYESFYPREGHILWITGILLILFSAVNQVPSGRGVIR
jgi:hypothetical protein